MRAVALSDPEIQEYVEQNFVPLKVSVDPGTKELPLDWPGVLGWRLAYQFMGGEKCNGFTGCMVVSPDLNMEYGGTGSASIAELFDSVAYNKEKFLSMLVLAQKRFAAEQSIRNDTGLSSRRKHQRIGEMRAQILSRNLTTPKDRSLPKGFSWIHALELFRQSGDI